MYLDRLQLLGFKSFPEKTALHFSHGISCIVGPNGCGKTNILDALRWVLGETRMSILRGGKLEEVIFSGTRDIKPLGMAEVNLTLDNSKGILASPYNQVTLTRRLYRSGDSEFFINKVPCRLKDITEMFLDTGLTSGTYSVIEQDMIDVILSDKAEDRRRFFEEASGITKYKQRKKDALRKLENTEADLLRLEDLYSEVSSQANSLKRQVSKAKRHQELNKRIEELGVRLAIDQWVSINSKLDSLESQKTEIKDEIESLRSEEKVIDLDREKFKLTLSEKENALREKRENIAQLTEKLHSYENRISVLREKLENTRNRHIQTVEEIRSHEHRQESLEEEIDQADSEVTRLKTESSELSQQVAKSEEALDQVSAKLNHLIGSYDRLQEDIDRIEKEINSSQENQITLNLKYTTSLEKTEELENEISSLEQDLKSYDDEKAELEKKVAESNSFITSKQNNLNEYNYNLSQLEEEFRQSEVNCREIDSRTHQLEAELKMVEKIIHQYEGYTSGAAQIGKIKDRFPGILDTVANIINPPEKYQACVQTVLGELSNYFVVRDQKTAEDVVAYGRENDFGRFGLIILENVPEADDPEISFPNNPGIHGQLYKFIQTEPEYQRLSRYLFKDIIVADRLFEQTGISGFDMVSPEGEMLDFSKSLAIGGTEEILLVGRKNQFEELKQLIAQLSEKRSRLNARQEEINSTRDEYKQRVDNTSDLIAEKKEELASLNAILSQCRLKINSTSGQVDEKRKYVDSLRNQLEEIDNEKSGLGKKVSTQRSHLEENQGQARSLKEQINELTQTRDKSSQSLSDLKMRLFTIEASLDTAQNNHCRLNELKTEIDNSLSDKTRLINDLVLTSTEIKRELIQLENDLERTFDAKEKASDELISAEGEIAEIDAKFNEYDKRLKQLRARLEELSGSLHNTDLKLNSLATQKDSLLADTLERYDCDLSAQSREIHLADQEREESQTELNDLKDKLQKLGPVNLLALEEYDQTRSRADFLKNQIEDLNKAKEDLRLTISRINSTARKKFIETFKIVRENFQNVFCELFEGGEANLRLDENVDPLEATIHISARPRGKKLLSIHQLSGGERALSALSLLFAFYMVKPSPFCILDEVDAPLDDANIGRFLKLIKRFTENTQFIIITHNKLTMEAAETLYGITMSKPGVSQVVSVNLKRGVEQVELIEKIEGDELTDEPADDSSELETEQEERIETDEEVEVTK